MITVAVDDPEDPRVASYRNIRERDLTGRAGRFIAEGKVVLDVLFAAKRFEVESALVLESRLPGLASTLPGAPDGMPVFVASARVMDAIAGFHIHRGILAVGKKRETETVDTVLQTMPGPCLLVACVGIANHDNMGAIFRNAAAFGADAVFMDATCCDPLYRKAIRVSVGAALKIPFAIAGSADDLIEVFTRHAIDVVALSPRGDVDIRALAPGPRTVLVVGTEGEGLPDRLLSRLRTARIAMAAGFDSLNVATASAIALHELSSKSRG